MPPAPPPRRAPPPPRDDDDDDDDLLRSAIEASLNDMVVEDRRPQLAQPAIGRPNRFGSAPPQNEYLNPLSADVMRFLARSADPDQQFQTTHARGHRF